MEYFYLHTRQKMLLRYLLTRKDWVKGQDIAAVLGVTDRTVRNDIAYINSLTKDSEEIITSMKRKGYRIKNCEKAREILKLARVDSPDNPDERINYILKKLIFEKKELDIYQLADEIMVSESTVVGDLRRLNKIVSANNRDLIVVKKSSKIFLKGSEKDKRSLLSELLFKETNGSFFDVSKYKKYFKDVDLDLIQKHLLETVKKYNFSINEMAVVNLLIHIAITVDRIKNTNFLDISTSCKNMVNTVEYKIAKELCTKLEDEFRIKFPPEEVLYVSYLILGREKIQCTCTNRNELKDIVEPYYISLTAALLNSIATEYGIDFTRDDTLLIGLCLHLKIMYFRIKSGMVLRNPILEDLKRRYPFIFEIAVFLSREFCRLTGLKVNEDEIGFIALHLGAAFERYTENKNFPKRVAIVCPTGYTTSNILLSKINSIYKEKIKVLGVFSFMELDSIKKDNPDFIFATVPLEHDLPINTIIISPFLDEKDKKLIDNTLNLYCAESKTESLRGEADKFFKEELFYKNLVFQNEFQVIDFMAKELYEKGYVPQNYPQLVIEREKLSSTSFDNLVAIPHPVLMSAYETVISVAILNKPVMWGKHKVQLVLMFAIKSGDRKKLDALYNHIIDAIDRPGGVSSLIESRDFYDFKSRLLNLNYENE